MLINTNKQRPPFLSSTENVISSLDWDTYNRVGWFLSGNRLTLIPWHTLERGLEKDFAPCRVVVSNRILRNQVG